LRRDEILAIQNNATILVNPRQNNEEFTRYSFPSKNMEYLSSGKPVLAYKLDGIPEEYDNYMFYVIDDSIEALTRKIVEVCSYNQEYLTSFGAAAKGWVLKEKNCVVQTKKIINMISEMQSVIP
jgi:glycosyltransferase involved in cell wall biosynthesis